MRTTINCTLMLALLGFVGQAMPVSAHENSGEIEALKQQVELLLTQNREMHERLAAMEKAVKAQPGQATPPAVAATDKETADEAPAEAADEDAGHRINEYITLTGLVEADVVTGEDFEGSSTSAIDLSTVEFGVEAQVGDWTSAAIVIDYDSDDDDLYIDEASVGIGNPDASPLALTAGKVYLPFGDFSTNMIQDPFTLTLGEINAPAVVGTFESNGFSAALFGYQGMDEVDADTRIRGIGVQAGYGYEGEGTEAGIGVAWTSNIADSGGIGDAFDAAGVEGIADQVGGVAASLGVTVGPVGLIAEYVTALDSFLPAELPFGEGGAEPKAWNAELSYTTAVWGKELVLAAGYQRSEEALALELPEQRLLGAATLGILPGLSLLAEAAFDEDYGLEDGGTGEDAQTFTTRLSYEF